MPSKPSGSEPLRQEAYVFEASFTDNTKIRIFLDKDFGSKAVAEQDALRYVPRLGKLPSLYRQNIRYIVVQKGGIDTTAFAEDLGHFFVIYSDNATKRIGTHDLEETFFHEGSHASIQIDHLTGAAWQSAKAADNAYITNYAQSNAQEDFAESALFAYTIIYHPERFPAADRAKIEAQIPNRIAFFRNIFTTQAGSSSPPAPEPSSYPPPTGSPVPGQYSSKQDVKLAASGAKNIRYTTNDTDPTCSSGTRYTKPLSIKVTTTIKAIACYDKGTSEVASLVYTLGASSSYPPPTGSPVPGQYSSKQDVKLAASGAKNIRYTTNDTDPTCSSGTRYTKPLSIKVTTTIKAIACYDKGTSEVASLVYAIAVTSSHADSSYAFVWKSIITKAFEVIGVIGSVNLYQDHFSFPL